MILERTSAIYFRIEQNKENMTIFLFHAKLCGLAHFQDYWHFLLNVLRRYDFDTILFKQW